MERCPGCGIPMATCSRPECEVARLKAQLAAARRVIEAADEMRSSYRKQMGPDGPEVCYDDARAEFDKVEGGTG